MNTDLPKDDANDRQLTERRQSIRDNEEALRILREADESSERPIELAMPLPEIEAPKTPKVPRDTQDPKRAHKLYYGHVMRMLRKYLKGIPKEASSLIREQVRLYLNEGETKGRDSRMTYYHLYEEASRVMQEWASQYGGHNLPELYNVFRELNDRREELKRKAPNTAAEAPSGGGAG